MPTITLNSGAELTFNLSEAEPAEDLLDAVMAELGKVNIDLTSLSLSDVSGAELNTLKNLLCGLLGSKHLRGILYRCASKCLYQGQRITKDTFAPEDARRDFIPVMWEVLRGNLFPYFAGLDLKSLTGILRSFVRQELPSTVSREPVSEPSAS